MNPTTMLTLSLLALAFAPQEAISPRDVEAAHRLDNAAISAAEMQAHVSFLASDLLEGRSAGKRGSEIAAQYVAAQFEAMGLTRIGESWTSEFDLHSASGAATAVISLGGNRYEGASLVQVQSNSGSGRVQAVLASSGADALEGKAILVGGVDGRREMRKQAEDLANAGAAAVLFVSERPWIDLSSGSARRERSTSAPTPPESLDELDGEMGLEDVALEGVQIRVVTSTDMIEEDFDDIGGGNVVMGSPSGGFGFGGGSSRLSIPVLLVSRSLGDVLREAAEQGEPVTLEVERAGRASSANVLGLIPGTDPELADEYVVVGAHYDHVGISRKGSVMNGADDNASGTAGVMEIAEAVAYGEIRPRRSILFAAWGAEEVGLVGARAFIEQPPIPHERIVAYVNLDMISRNDPADLDLICASDTLAGWGKEAAAQHGFQPDVKGGMLLHMSDSSPFVGKKIPTIFLNTGMHSDLHGSGDDPEKIDADKAARAAHVALDVALRAANTSEKPAFTQSQRGGGLFGGRSSGPSRSERTIGLYVSLRSSGEWAEVRKVEEDSLAERMGFSKKDRIVRIGEHSITGRKDIRPALSALKVGDRLEVEIRRTAESGEEQTLVLTGTIEE